MGIYPAPDRPGSLLLGSANWTERNLGDLNLEADLLIEAPGPALDTYLAWYESTWVNSDLQGTVDYETWSAYGWTRFWKTALYRVQEALGAGSF